MALDFFTSCDLPASISCEIVEFLDNQNTGHPFQFPQWAQPQTRLVLRRESGKIQWFASWGAQFPLSTHFPWVRGCMLNRGPICDDPELFRSSLSQFSEHMDREKITFIEAAPERWSVPDSNQARLFNGDWTALDQVRYSMRLDLTKTEEEILAGFRATTRYKVRKAERAGLTVVQAKEEGDIEEFSRLYSRLVVRKGLHADSAAHLRQIMLWFIAEPERGTLLLARCGPTAIGGAVIARCGRRCWYVWGANDRHENFSAGHLVQWQAILWARSQGCTEYDFGGYTPGATSGPAWFKEGFGGHVVEFIPAHRYVLRPQWYRLVDSIAKMRR